VTDPSPPPRGLARASSAFVVYLLGVIVFGAWVRITHSGAGCGQHWPLCNGEVLPPSPSIETIIEFTHRTTSGLCGLLAIGLLVWSIRATGAHSSTSRATFLTLVFVIFEGVIGAAIVLNELVLDNDSMARAVVISLHLSNTLLLMAAASLAAWFARGGRVVRPSMTAVVAGTFLAGTAMTGAVTALGDTIFPVGSNAASTAAGHFLIQLRAFHPVLAAAVGLALLPYARAVRERTKGSHVERWAVALAVLVCVQIAVGVVNILLAAPAAMQLIHLLVAQCLWMSFLLASLAAPSDAPG
jgi:heme a synthase